MGFIAGSIVEAFLARAITVSTGTRAGGTASRGLIAGTGATTADHRILAARVFVVLLLAAIVEAVFAPPAIGEARGTVDAIKVVVLAPENSSVLIATPDVVHVAASSRDAGLQGSFAVADFHGRPGTGCRQREGQQ